jgi:hypothetical protein
MNRDRVPHSLQRAADLAGDVISELSESLISAHSYQKQETEDGRLKKAADFWDFMFKLDDDVNELAQELKDVGSCFVLAATGPVSIDILVSESAHHLIHFLGMEVIGEICRGIWNEACPDEFKQGVEYGMPTSFFPLEECIPYTSTGISSFLKDMEDMHIDHDALNYLSVQREQELVRACITAGPIPVVKRSVDPAKGETWHHEPTESRPADYKNGPIVGMKKEICIWMGERDSKTMRRLEQKAKNGTVWVVRLSGQQWEVWFKDEKTYQDVDRNRRYRLKPTLKPTQ